MKPFDPIRTPLLGINLIEAAAGTGKTYAIESLYVRLVLEKQLPVEQVLVMSFTRAATAELRERIYRRLAGARDAVAGAAVGADDFLTHWLEHHPDPGLTDRLLRQALIDFDRAAIFTLHGFCQRLLYENVFETASDFNAELVQDQTPILLEVVEDFWRRSICDQPAEFLHFARTDLGDPLRLLKLAQTYSTAECAVTPRLDRPALRSETLQEFRNRIEDLRRSWRSGREEVRRVLLEAPLNGKRFGSVQLEKDGSGSRRHQIVQGLISAMDTYIAQEPTRFPPVAAVEKLAVSTLAASTLSRRQPPSHAVFEACGALQQCAQRLAREMARQMIYLKSKLIAASKVELERRKRASAVLSFDDLLRQVARALDGRRGNELAGLVRRRYQAALVDEFQDTDDLQYAVFSQLFATPPHLLIMIGDPKQAIYGFRGADLFSYLRAARDAKERFTLDRNWRTTDELVRAVNTLYSRSDAPFLFHDIRFAPARAARRGCEAEAPMTIWHLDSRRYRDDGKPIAIAEAQTLIAQAVTEQVRRLIEPSSSTVAPGDIAVLVRTNRQANLMKQHLRAAGVAAVVYCTADVFESSEARELLVVLASIAEPQSVARLKSAMATCLLGATAAEIAVADRDEDGVQRRVQRHGEYLRVWSQHGFAPMFRRFLKNERVKQRLTARPNGERRLTNFLHLTERLHRAAEEENTGPAGLVKWLARQLDPQTQRSEENQQRLESDAFAVKIVTVHRSKGLEYPVVFCPFAWTGSALRGVDFFFHDPHADFRLTVDISGDRHSPNRIHAQNENLAENLRLLYVSLTRAKHRCYLAWGRISSAETSALAYLLRGRAAEEETFGSADWIERLASEYGSIGDDELRKRLDELAEASGGTIVVRPLPDTAPPGPSETDRAHIDLDCREFHGRVDPGWALTSYSALVSGAGADAPDRDDGAWASARDERTENSGSSTAPGLFEFPAGARAGTFFHSIFEVLDFALSGPHPLVRSKLKEYGYEPRWEDPVCAMIVDVLSMPMFGPGSALRLTDIRPDRKVTEMEFYFPLKRLTPARLEEAFALGGAAIPIAEGPFPETIGRLRFAPIHGYMKGFIDLVFEHHGRFYLVDWKSNRLGPTLEDYHRSRLSAVMAEQWYHLQYHLYTLAFHQYLRRRVPAYEYARDFGGICYVFLKGVTSDRDPDFGLYYDRPAPALIQALAETLIADDGQLD